MYDWCHQSAERGSFFATLFRTKDQCPAKFSRPNISIAVPGVFILTDLCFLPHAGRSSMEEKRLREGAALVAEAEQAMKTSLLKWKPDYDNAAVAYG